MKRNIYIVAALLFTTTICDFTHAQTHSEKCSKKVSLASHLMDSEKVDEELKHIEVGSRRAIQTNAAEEQSELCFQENVEQIDENHELSSRGCYCNSHNHAYHRAIAVSYYGNEVTLEDGSIWKVAGADQWKTLNWLSTDTILVMQNKWLFSSYKFMLVNQNTGSEVEVNLSLGPYYSGYYTHWVVGIDYLNKLVTLDDGSIWEMSLFDSLIVNQWMIDDTVIIGINQSGFANHPNILINVNMLNYAKGICLN